jgi:hypothetical protein
MQSVSQTENLGQITGPPYITLVDLDGHPVPSGEKGLPPHDPFDPETWPESIEVDAIHYEISDPFDRAALEQAAFDEECDRRDMADDSVRWHIMMASVPPSVASRPTDAELAQIAAHGCA